VWRKDDTGSVPRFSTSSSPLVTDGKVIMQYGGEDKGGMIAYDLKTGDEKWKWPGDGTAYASPVVMTVDKTKLVVAVTGKSVVALTLGDGKKVWDAPYVAARGGYNAATPMPDGATLVYTGSGRGTKAVKLEKKDDKYTATEVWANKEQSAMYCTPVVKDGMVYGQTTDDKLFCLDEKTGDTVWTKKLKSVGGRTIGYGSIVDAGKVLFSLTPAGELLAFEPGGKECKEVAKYSVATGGTYAFPVVTDKRVFIKDGTSVTLWTVE